jgi:hypothetical protein
MDVVELIRTASYFPPAPSAIGDDDPQWRSIRRRIASSRFPSLEDDEEEEGEDGPVPPP